MGTHHPVSNTANYLVTTAGLSGFAVRMYLLSQTGRVPGTRRAHLAGAGRSSPT
jgi:hypothetical protein